MEELRQELSRDGGSHLVLGFAAFFTAPLADNYLVTVVRIGVQISVQYLLVAAGQVISEQWIVAVESYSPDKGFGFPLTV